MASPLGWSRRVCWACGRSCYASPATLERARRSSGVWMDCDLYPCPCGGYGDTRARIRVRRPAFRLRLAAPLLALVVLVGCVGERRAAAVVSAHGFRPIMVEPSGRFVAETAAGDTLRGWVRGYGRGYVLTVRP